MHESMFLIRGKAIAILARASDGFVIGVSPTGPDIIGAGWRGHYIYETKKYNFLKSQNLKYYTALQQETL